MKKPSWMSEFKDFISRGNVIDLAVGVVIGGAFTAIVNGIVDAIIKPIITLISGQTSFDEVTIGIFPIGTLISAIINFLLISFVVFWMVKVINGAMNKVHHKEEEPEADPEPSKEEVLLTEKLLFIQNSSSCLHCFPPKKQIKFLFILKIMEQQCFADSSRLCHIRNRRSPVTGVTKHLKSGIYNPLLLFFRQAIKFLVHSTDSLRFLYDSI